VRVLQDGASIDELVTPEVRPSPRRSAAVFCIVHDASAAAALTRQPCAAQLVTAPYDPRFPNTNQARHCFIRYNEYYK
jgi:hypothetical protein